MTSARSGRIESIGDGQFLVLANGQRLESSLTASELKISEFEELRPTASAATSSASATAHRAKARSHARLLREPTAPNLGELAWRIGMALAALNFVVLAITVSSVNPRAGRSGNLVFALFAFVVYYNLLNLGAELGRLGPGRLRAVPAGAARRRAGWPALLWLAKQHNNWTFAAAARAPCAPAGARRMRTIRRLIYREVLASVVFVAVGFLALFFFFDFVDELPNVGKAGTRLPADPGAGLRRRC